MFAFSEKMAVTACSNSMLKITSKYNKSNKVTHFSKYCVYKSNRLRSYFGMECAGMGRLGQMNLAVLENMYFV